MRLITFDQGRVGVTDGAEVWDLTARLGALSVKALIQGDLAAAERACRGPGDLRFDEVALGLPLPDPAKIICVGVNYMDRNAEYRDGSEAPKYPSLFMRTPLSFRRTGAPIWRPRESGQLDYEGEIVLVIGKGGRRIPAERAHAHIAGLTAMNEGSVRDWLRHAKFNVTQGKNFDRSGGLGPWIETDLSGLSLTDMTVETRVNGEVRQRDTTASMAFPVRADHRIRLDLRDAGAGRPDRDRHPDRRRRPLRPAPLAGARRRRRGRGRGRRDVAQYGGGRADAVTLSRAAPRRQCAARSSCHRPCGNPARM